MTRWVCRNYKLGVLLIGGIVGANALFILTPMGVSLLTVLCLMVAAELPWLLLYGSCIKRRSREALVAMNRDCDPKPLLELAQDSLDQFDRRGKSGRASLLAWRLNKSSALIALGRYEEALTELDSIQSRLQERFQEPMLVCRNNRAAALGALGRVEEMEREMEEVGRLLAGVRPNTGIFQASQIAIRLNQCALLLLKEGGSPRVERLYEELLEEDASPRNQVIAHLGLAKCALAQGDKEGAKPHLRYVLDHGNKLVARQTAQDLWESLGG